LYSGPEFTLTDKYSNILKITFVTFMYGFVMPILFPIAFLTIGVLYLTEKFMLVKVYKNPPMLDIKSNLRVLKTMRYAPILFCIVGYWMCSSKELIHNVSIEA
jgi:hypothetical protein